MAFLGHHFVNTTGRPAYLSLCDTCGKPMRDENHWCGCCIQDTGLREELEVELERLRVEVQQLHVRAAYAERVWRDLGASREQLQAEVERLTIDNRRLTEMWDTDRETLTAEVERLRARLEGVNG